MDVRNCRKCGKLYNFISGQHICPACKEALEKTFADVRDFIRDNRQATMQQISEACNVETSQIQQWIREERLEFTADSPIKIQCETCGANIRSGRYCDKCKQTVASGLTGAMGSHTAQQPSASAKPVTGDHQGMRFIKK